METYKKAGYEQVNGINMYYEIYGEGEIPLALIHGGGSTIQSSFVLFIRPMRLPMFMPFTNCRANDARTIHNRPNNNTIIKLNV
jgi:hypothetical protein